MKNFHAAPLAALLLVALLPAALPAQKIAFGGIELASSSIKGLTFTFQPGADSDAPVAERSDRMKRLQYAERNAGFISMRDGCKLSAKGLDALVKNTKDVITELQDGAKAKSLGQLQLYAVGSSGLGAVCNTDEIVARVQAATGLCMDFISASDEARYSLGFVLPRDRYRSLILDIGSGNSKAGYYVMTRGVKMPPREWHGVELPFGARTLKDKALALVKKPSVDSQGNAFPGLTFYQAIDVVLQKEVLPQVEQLKDENSALGNFSLAYMVGGVVWATSTRTRPVQQEEWAINSLSTANFDAVLADVRNNTFSQFDGSEFSATVSPATREGAENELTEVNQRFDPQTLYAGVSLARFIVHEFAPAARIYFPTTASWISGYARERFKEANRAVPTCPTNLPAAAATTSAEK